MHPFFNQVKERNTIQYTLLYSGSVWGFIQVIDFLVQKFGWPENIVKVIAIVGFSSIPSAFVFFYYRAQTNSLKRQGLFYLVNLTMIFLIFFYSRPNDRGALNDEVAQRGEKPSVAVLPFENLTGDPNQEYFSDGITEEIILKLSMIQKIRVSSKTSIRRFKEIKISTKEIARDLGVKTILVGSVRRSGDLVKITAELINPETDENLWTETYERGFIDIFKIQAEIARGIAKKFKIAISKKASSLLDAQSTTSAKKHMNFI